MLETLAAVSAALSQTFEADLVRQSNRMAVAAAVLGAERGRGKNVAWDVEFGENTADAVDEGSDIAEDEFTTDSPQPAILNWAHYRQSFKISETEVDAAESSIGSPEELIDIFGERVFNAHTKLCSVINADIYTGTGLSARGKPNLVGFFGGPLEPTGIYAGVNRAQFAEFAGNVLGNGGVPRPLSIDLLSQLEGNVYDACGMPPNLILASTGVVRRYAGFFEEVRRVVQDGRGPLEFNAGASNLFFRGIPVLRDRNCPRGRLVMLNTDFVRIRFLPTRSRGDALGYADTRLVGASGNLRTATDIPARIVLLSKTGDNIKASVKTTIQMVVRRPHTCGYLADVEE